MKTKKEFKLIKNGVNWTWGSEDGRIKNHLTILQWDKRINQFRVSHLWIQKNQINNVLWLFKNRNEFNSMYDYYVWQNAKIRKELKGADNE